MIIDHEAFFTLLTSLISQVLPAYHGEIPRNEGGAVAVAYPAATFDPIIKGQDEGTAIGILTVEIWTKTTSIRPGLQLSDQISGKLITGDGGPPHDAGTLTARFFASTDNYLQAFTDPDVPGVRRVRLNYDFTIYSRMEG